MISRDMDERGHQVLMLSSRTEDTSRFVRFPLYTNTEEANEEKILVLYKVHKPVNMVISRIFIQEFFPVIGIWISIFCHP